VIAVDGLTKSYGRRRVLDGVTFACPPGTVTGFLGPNGAGKSTTLRILAGMTRQDAGTATVEGVPFADLARPAGTVGMMLDASALHPGRTAGETLALHALAIGADASAAPALLRRVGLPDVGRRRVGTFSLGMRQRLGIAVALVGSPRILILDEPYNGLDPEGVFWVRGLLRDFADAGGGALVSSHLLNEIRETVDRLVILDHGRVHVQGTLSDLLRGQATSVVASDPVRLAQVLDARGLAFQPAPDGALRVTGDPDLISRVLFDERIRVLRFAPEDGASVESLYFATTEDAR
jgi:ABC-2 type transport system ATP-binding protein